MKLWLATENINKKKEIQAMMEPFGIEVRTILDLTDFIAPPEDGETFAENALIKARALYNHVNEPVMADDSGMAVDALNGAPGIFSARYAGPDANDADRRALILKNIKDSEDRNAQFICALAFIDASGEQYVFNGILQGTILPEDRGTGGFGYDPIFHVASIDKSLAEITGEEKNAMSHRALAMQQLVSSTPFLKTYNIDKVEVKK